MNEVFSTWWFQVLAGGLVGVVASYVFYVKALRDGRFDYEVESQTVLSPKLPRRELKLLEISFSNKPIERLVTSRVIFWNSGGGHITESAQTPLDPIRLQVQAPGEILEAYVERTTNAANGIEIKHENNQWLVAFKFLNQGDGAAIRVLHTSTIVDAAMAGQLVGVKVRQTAGKMRVLPNSAKVLVLVSFFFLLQFVPGWLDTLFSIPVDPRPGFKAIMGTIATLLAAVGAYEVWRGFNKFGLRALGGPPPKALSATNDA